ncbi:MAG: TIGR01777 family oxidoreductase [Desulfobacteraceae bacterium]|jgi:uncharacterized protein
MKILITGGTGFVGTHLSHACMDAGHEVTVLGTRTLPAQGDPPLLNRVAADTTRPGPWQTDAAAADLIFNLAGRNIFQRWNRKTKRQIYESRILTTRNLVAALPEDGAAVLISTSAVGYYGDCGDIELNEESPVGTDFLASLARDWEREALKAEAKGVRVVLARFGVVLGRGGGALAKMIPAFKSFMGGPLGNGRQWFPWIHVRDLVKALTFLARRSDLAGPFNLCAPCPVTNAAMARALGKALGRPAKLPVPAFMVRMMAGELGNVMLASQRTLPVRLLRAGFEFDYRHIDGALAAIVGP